MPKKQNKRNSLKLDLRSRSFKISRTYLDVDADLLGGVPKELDDVEVVVVLQDVVDAVRERHVDLDDAVARPRQPPRRDLLTFHVLQPALVEAQPHHALLRPRHKTIEKLGKTR